MALVVLIINSSIGLTLGSLLDITVELSTQFLTDLLKLFHQFRP